MVERLLAVLVAAVGGALLFRAACGRKARRAPGRRDGRFDIARCPAHGIACDVEFEACPACAQGSAGAP